MQSKIKDYALMLETIFDGAYLVDKNRQIVYWNNEAERISGFTKNEVVGHHCYDNILNHVDDNGTNLCINGCPLKKTLEDGKNRTASVFLHHKDGHRVSVSIRIIPLYVGEELVGAMELFVENNTTKANITKRMDELKYMALHDQLTGLNNRRFIDASLVNYYREYQIKKKSFAIFMMDIDDFKDINDNYGHHVGDQILKMIASTLAQVFGKDNIIGRWGGEEFMALVSGLSSSELEKMAEKVRALVEQSIYRRNNGDISVTISIGVACIKAGDTIFNVQKRADRALYFSKSSGKNCVTFTD